MSKDLGGGEAGARIQVKGSERTGIGLKAGLQTADNTGRLNFSGVFREVGIGTA